MLAWDGRWVAVQPVYRKGHFYSAGETFDAPEDAVKSLLANGTVIRHLEERDEQAAPESAPSVVEAPVASPEEQAVEEEAEKAPTKSVRKKTASPKASKKVSEEE